MKNYLLTGLMGLSIVFTGCSDDDVSNGGSIEQGEGSISVRVVGDSNGIKSKAATGATNESDINDFQVYVFGWDSGILEKAVKVEDPEGLEIQVKQLSTSTTKKVVVLTNMGNSYPDVKTYSELSDALWKIDLEKQSPTATAANGFIMTGISDAPVQLIKDDIAEDIIHLKRVVAKVSLESLLFVPEEGHDLSKLTITGVAVQRVAPQITLSPVISYYSTADGGFHYGGFDNNDDEQLRTKAYLADDLNLTNPAANQKYDLGNTFYVFPNHGDEEICTLLTIRAEYNGRTIYYPIKINHASTTEKFVHNNKHYKISLTLKKFGEGTVDPEVPPTEADLDVTLVVDPWDVVTQNEEW